MTKLIIFISYWLIGWVVQGISILLNDKCKIFNKITDNTFYHLFFDVNDSVFIVSYILYVAIWPLLIIIAVFAYPFATIKFLSNNNWSWKIDKETKN